jgi:hypothetical protein
LPESARQEVAKPQTSWTVTDRVYDLRPLDESPSLLMGSTTQVDAGHRCFIRLGAELPPGDYTINVERSDDGSDGLVLLYQTVAGKSGIRQINIGKSGVAKR